MNLEQNKHSIPLFYWSSKRFEGKPKENYGDLLSKYLVEKISGHRVKWVHPKKQPFYKLNKKNFLSIGSIVHHASKDSVIWGSGIIDQEQDVAKADIRAVRGPKTRDYLIQKDIDCPEIYGDPALLLPYFFNPSVKKKYKIGIVPHYVDYQMVEQQMSGNKEIVTIDLLTNDIEATTAEILACEKIISSSLHGLIVAHSYGIPAVWVRFSDKIFGNNIKYVDYFESVNLPTHGPVNLSSLHDLHVGVKAFNFVIPEELHLKKITKTLFSACPFRNTENNILTL